MTANTARAPVALVPPASAAPARRAIDLLAAERAAADLLVALGADLTGESLRGTPRRIAAAYAEMLTPQQFEPTTFPNDENYDELVVARSIPFHSLCEHHMLHARRHMRRRARPTEPGRPA